MNLSDRAEEILERLWVYAEEGKSTVDLGLSESEPAISELEGSGFIRFSGDRHEKTLLTEKGRKEGERVLRRHRLAERLFSDVLELKKSLIHPVSCQFEHLLHEGIEDNICILLGHPKTCPHGKPIPRGDCCRASRETVDKVISALSSMRVGQKARIAYIHTQDDSRLQKLLSIGALPGARISLIQRFPSFVFRIGHSEFAVDREMADAIYVRLER